MSASRAEGRLPSPAPYHSDGDARARTPREQILEALLDLRGVVPFDVSLVTVRHRPGGVDVPLHVYRMAPTHVQHGLNHFIPHSREFRAVEDRPRELLDWTRVPSFRESETARDHLLAAGYTQGVSLTLQVGHRAVGTFHFFNVGHTAEFSDAELQAIERARVALESAVRGVVEATKVALSDREQEVLSLVATGASNPQIADLLQISRRTVATHVEHILQKLHASNRLQAVVTAAKLNLI